MCYRTALPLLGPVRESFRDPVRRAAVGGCMLLQTGAAHGGPATARHVSRQPLSAAAGAEGASRGAPAAPADMIGGETTARKPADHGKPPVNMTFANHNTAKQSPVPGPADAAPALCGSSGGGRAAAGRR
jgi:hypothetical protein